MASAPPEFAPDPAYDATLPHSPRPIVILGAGGIVKDAHLPAYQKAGYPVFGIYNRTVARARGLASAYGIDRVFGDLAEAIATAPPGAVFDIALMPEQYLDVLESLPRGAAVLIQKPLGHSLLEAHELVGVCEARELVAAVNTQLRFAPYVVAARRLIASGTIGELYDIEVRVSVDTPWHLFPHVLAMDRLEINMHSVHYLDLMRSFVGDPDSVSAVTVRHPAKSHANSRSQIILHYADRPLRVVIGTNHDHAFGPKYEESFVKWEGTNGAVRLQMGLLLDYPDGGADILEYQLLSERHAGWRPLPFDGSWFPDAFIGSMGVLHRYLEGSIQTLPTSVQDVVSTMALVDAAYESSARGGATARR